MLCKHEQRKNADHERIRIEQEGKASDKASVTTKGEPMYKIAERNTEDQGKRRTCKRKCAIPKIMPEPVIVMSA